MRGDRAGDLLGLAILSIYFAQLKQVPDTTCALLRSRDKLGVRRLPSCRRMEAELKYYRPSDLEMHAEIKFLLMLMG